MKKNTEINNENIEEMKDIEVLKTLALSDAEDEVLPEDVLEETLNDVKEIMDEIIDDEEAAEDMEDADASVEEEDEDVVNIRNPKRKTTMGRFRPTSSINPDFILETKYFGDNEVAIAINQLKKICREKKLPMYVEVGPASDFISAYELGINTELDENIMNHVKVSNGFHVTSMGETKMNVADIV